MGWRRALPAAALLLLGTAMNLRADSVGSSIPDTHATTLAGQPVELPAALRGKVGVLVIGFSRGSRDGVSEWGRHLAAEFRNSAGVTYYEAAMLAEVPRLVRGVVIRAMRSSIPERAQPRFLILTENEAAWRSVAHYSHDDPYLLLVDQRGHVIWQTEGVPTEASEAELRLQLAKAASALQGR